MTVFNFIKKLLRSIFMPSLGQLEETAQMIWQEVNSPQYIWGSWDVEAPVTTEGWASCNGIKVSAALTMPSGVTLFNVVLIAAVAKFMPQSYKRKIIHRLVAHEYRHACQFGVLGKYAFMAIQKDASYPYGRGPLEQDAINFSKGHVTPWKEFVESLGLGLEYKEF